MTAETTARPKLTEPLLAARTRNGKPEQVWADGGAVKQDGRLRVHTCLACSCEVVWVKSNRTGKFYRAAVDRYADNVNGGAGAGRYYLKNVPHRCGEILADRARRDADRAARDAERAELARVADAEDIARGIGESLADEPRLLARAMMAYTLDPRNMVALVEFYDDPLAVADYIARGAGIRDFARQPEPFGPTLPVQS